MMDPSFHMSDCQRVSVGLKLQIIAKKSGFEPAKLTALYGSMYKAFSQSEDQDELELFIIDQSLFQATLNQIDTTLIESIDSDNSSEWLNLLDCMRLALKFKDELSLGFDKETWAYSVLSVLQVQSKISASQLNK